MRLVEIHGIFVNPDRVAYLSEPVSAFGGDPQAYIHFSGVKDDGVMVDVSLNQLVQMLAHG